MTETLFLGNTSFLNEVHQEFNSILTSHPSIDRLRIKIFFDLQENRREQYDTNINLLNEFLEQKQESTHIFEAWIWLLYLHLESNHLDQAKHIINSNKIKNDELSHSELEKIDTRILILKDLLQAIYFRKIKNYDKASELFNVVSESLQNKTKNFLNLLFQFQLGVKYQLSNDVERAIDIFEKCLDFIQNQGITNRFIELKIYNNLALINSESGNYEVALNYFQEAFNIAKGLDDIFVMSHLEVNIGTIFWRMGELNKTLEYMVKAIEKSKKINSSTVLGTAYMHTGIVYDLKGEFEQALFYYSAAMEVFKENKDSSNVAKIKVNIGLVYERLKEFQTAYNHYIEAQSLFNEKTDIIYLANLYASLYDVCQELGREEEADQYLQNLKTISDSLDLLEPKQLYRLAYADHLYRSNRNIQKAQAQQLYYSFLDEEIVNFDVTNIAILKLCEILHQEYQETKNEEVIIELRSVLDRIKQIAQQNNSFYLMTHYYSLMARVELISGNTHNALMLLNKGQQLAEEKGLDNLAMQLSNKFDTLLHEIRNIEELTDYDSELVTDLGIQGFKELVEDIILKKHVAPEMEEETPIMTLIISDTGLAIFSKKFSDTVDTGDQLIAGLLSALDSFFAETLKTQGGIQRLSHQEYTLIMKQIEEFTICYVVKGSTFYAKRKLDKFSTQIRNHNIVWDRLKDTVKRGVVLADTKYKLDQIAEQIFMNSDSLSN